MLKSDKRKTQIFNPLSEDRFMKFHKEFHGDTWDICERCGGKCEINKIGSLMPGEADYIAINLGVPVEEFKHKNLDGIETSHGVIDVLKLKPGCPFLSSDFRCTIPDVKVVLCDVYPIVFDVIDDVVHFELDSWCPIVRHVPELAREFETKAIPALHRLDAPVNWYRAVQLYDSLCVDYDKLFALRSKDLSYVTLSLDQVLACQADDAPPPDLKPSANLILPAPVSLSGKGLKN